MKGLFKGLKSRKSCQLSASVIAGSGFLNMNISSNLNPKSKRQQQLCKGPMPNQKNDTPFHRFVPLKGMYREIVGFYPIWLAGEAHISIVRVQVEDVILRTLSRAPAQEQGSVLPHFEEKRRKQRGELKVVFLLAEKLDLLSNRQHVDVCESWGCCVVHYILHRKKRFMSFPFPAGMSLTKLPPGRNNSVMTL